MCVNPRLKYLLTNAMFTPVSVTEMKLVILCKLSFFLRFASQSHNSVRTNTDICVSTFLYLTDDL